MSHRITYRPSGILLSSQIGEIGISVDGTAVDVTLTASTGQLTILSERYYAYVGNVKLYDIGSLIEAEMQGSGLSYATFTLTVGNGTAVHDSVTLNVLYCDRYTLCTNAEVFLAENFLTTLQHRRVAPGDTLSLDFFAKAGESLQASVTVRFRKVGSEVVWPPAHFTLNNGQTASATGVFQLNISQDYFISQFAASNLTKDFEWEVVAMGVNVGQRAATLYLDRSLDGLRDTFLFRNAFNVWDAATLPAVTITKTAVDRSTAVVNGTSSFYNQKVTKTYETEIGPLTSDECEWLDQLATSHWVMRFVANPCEDSDPVLLAPVLITDSDFEVSDTDEKPNSVKLTWRYADNRPAVALGASPGIFRSPFNLPYS